MQIEQFLAELKSYGIENNIPNISHKNALYLQKLIQKKSFKNILEIGTANGYSTIHFALEIQKTWGQITTIEFSQLAYEQANENFIKAGVESLIRSYFWDAREIIPLLEERYDFVFIDGLKKASLNFFQIVWPIVETWGIIVIDDVIKFRHKMEDLYLYLDTNNIAYTVLAIDEDDGIMLVEKK